MRSNAAPVGRRARALRVAAFWAALLAVWWSVTRAGLLSEGVLPAPAAVLDTLIAHVTSGDIPRAVLASLQRMALGYGLSIIVGMAVGTLIATSRWADDTIGGIVLGIQSLPSITWLPLAVLWFGRDERAIVFVVLMGSAFSIATSARAGILGIPPLLTRAAGTLGASRWQAYAYVVLPGMLPAMVQGMKQGWSFAWRALMAGELLFVTAGLGRLLSAGRDSNDTSLMFAMMAVIIVVGVSVDRLIFGRAESWVRERWGYAAA